MATNLIQDFEDHAERISNDGGLGVLALVVGNPHDHVRGVHQGLLVEGRSDLAGDLEVNLVGHRLVGQVVLAGHREAEVAGRDDPVVVLDDDIIGIAAGSLPLDAAVEVVVAEGDGELELAVDVLHAGLGASLGVDLSVEEGGGENVGDHVTGVAVDADVVAGGQLVGGGFLDGQVGLLDLKHIKVSSSSLQIDQ